MPWKGGKHENEATLAILPDGKNFMGCMGVAEGEEVGRRNLWGDLDGDFVDIPQNQETYLYIGEW